MCLLVIMQLLSNDSSDHTFAKENEWKSQYYFVYFSKCKTNTSYLYSIRQVHGEHVRPGQRALSGPVQAAGARPQVAARAGAT